MKAPFNPTRAKATVYQTGVWTPLIVAGPLVEAPGREVGAMVNIADIFQLFGEMAGVDVHALVPKSRPIDSVSMLPYLRNPDQRGIRKTNFTQHASNIHAAGYVVPPCVVASVNTCVQLFPTQQLCASKAVCGGDVPDGSSLPVGAGAPQADCCSVNKYLSAQTPPHATAVLPDWQMAMRDDRLQARARQPRPTTTRRPASAQRPPRRSSTGSTRRSRRWLDNAARNLLTPGQRLDRTRRQPSRSSTHGTGRSSRRTCPAPATAIWMASSMRPTSTSSITGRTDGVEFELVRLQLRRTHQPGRRALHYRREFSAQVPEPESDLGQALT